MEQQTKLDTVSCDDIKRPPMEEEPIDRWKFHTRKEIPCEKVCSDQPVVKVVAPGIYYHQEEKTLIMDDELPFIGVSSLELLKKSKQATMDNIQAKLDVLVDLLEGKKCPDPAVINIHVDIMSICEDIVKLDRNRQYLDAQILYRHALECQEHNSGADHVSIVECVREIVARKKIMSNPVSVAEKMKVLQDGISEVWSRISCQQGNTSDV